MRATALSSTIVIGLALAGGMWTFGVSRYLRHHGPYPRLSPALHQVDLSHGETPTLVRSPGSTHTTASWATHTRVSFPEYSVLAGSGLPLRGTATFRSRLLVSRPGRGPAAALVCIAFVVARSISLRRGLPFGSLNPTALLTTISMLRLMRQPEDPASVYGAGRWFWDQHRNSVCWRRRKYHSTKI